MSNNWSFVNFGEVFAEPVRNGVYKAAEFQGSGMHIVNMKELFGYEFIGNQKMRKIELSNDEKERFLLKNGDLLFARRSIVEEGSGKISLIKGLTGELTFESSIIRVRLNLEKAYPLFYYYYFSSPVGKPSITALSSGVTVKGIRGSDLRNVKIRYPPLTIQQKIAAILSAYDELIENNLKRIKLLEEMAQITYEEWFVRMKFPGHETTPVDSETGLPVGWEKATCFDLIDVLSGGTPKTDVAEYWGGDIKFFTPKDAANCVYTLDTEKTLTEPGLKKCNSKLYPKNTIFITARGTVGKLNLAREAMAMNQSCYALIAKNELSQLFLFCALSNAIGAFKGAANGGVFDAIVIDTFRFISITKPDKNLIGQFDSFVKPIFESIENLIKQNQLLKEASDILLPRLMTGMIDVEQLVLPESLGELSLNLTQEPQAA